MGIYDGTKFKSLYKQQSGFTDIEYYNILKNAKNSFKACLRVCVITQFSKLVIYEHAVFIICPILVAWNTMGSDEGSVCKCGHKQSQHWTVSRLYKYQTPCSVARCNCLSFIDSKEGKGDGSGRG